MYDYNTFMKQLEKRNPGEPEFIQAASEIVASIIDTVNSNPMYLKNKILDRIVEPERIQHSRFGIQARKLMSDIWELWPRSRNTASVQ